MRGLLITFTTFSAALLWATPPSAVAAEQVSRAECTFRVTTGPFVQGNHRLTYYKDGTTVLKIDGHEYSGTDGDVPDREILSISVQIASEKHDLPSKSFAGVFDPHVDCPTGCTLKCSSAGSLRLKGGDGAGSYTVEWTIDTAEEGSVTRRIWEQPNPEKPKKRRFRFEVGR